MSLFNTAKKEGSGKKKAAKKEKLRVTVNEPGHFEKIQRLSELREQQKSLAAEADLIEEEVKEIGKEKWAELYSENGINPESIMIESKRNNDTAQYMLLISDRYISIDGERAEALSEKYGNDIVTENETYKFDNAMVAKYAEVISNLIVNCDEIAEADKSKIIKADVSYSVTKGTVNKLKIYSDKTGEEVIDVMEEIKPVSSMKNVEYIQGVATH